VSLGELPSEGILSSLPCSGEGEDKVGEDNAGISVMKQASSLLALLDTKDQSEVPVGGSRVWLGEGLGSISKKIYDKMLKWDYMDLNEFRMRSPLEKISANVDTQKLVVLPGFELSQVKSKPIKDIVTWVHCFARYTAAMSGKFPNCMGGFMSHLLTVLKAYVEVEDPAWCLYDIAFREKMAATGEKVWSGMDVQLYQEICGARPRKRGVYSLESGCGSVGAMKLPGRVCWKFNNEGSCKFGKDCRFLHVCESCGEGHSKLFCGRNGAAKKKKL